MGRTVTPRSAVRSTMDLAVNKYINPFHFSSQSYILLREILAVLTRNIREISLQVLKHVHKVQFHDNEPSIA